MNALEQLERYGYRLVKKDNYKIIIEKGLITIEYDKILDAVRSHEGIFETEVSGTVIDLIKRI